MRPHVRDPALSPVLEVAQVEGPLAGHASVDLASYDLTRLGYVQEEFLLSGRAPAFAGPRPQSADGVWSARPTGTAAYTTRVVVVRPSDAGAFDGTVVLEWLNVSGGQDVGTDWLYTHRHLLRTGAAWVGVSAQRAGIAGGGLKQGNHLMLADPKRYARLDHPGDAYAFGIYSAAAAAVRVASSPLLGGATADVVLAVGESQAAIYLVTYVNAVDPLHRVVDGVLVHGRSARGAWVDGTLWDARRLLAESAGRRPSLSGHRIRTDVRVPVLTVQSETDVFLLGGCFARQPDSDRIRLWEVAGAAHFDTYGLSAAYDDDGSLGAAGLARALAPVRSPRGYRTSAPVNSGPQQHYVLQAAVAHLARWARGGAPPPSFPVLRTRRWQPLRAERDDVGNVLGGVRSPWVDAPVSLLSGLGQRVAGFGMLFGSTVALSAAQLRARYPNGLEQQREEFRAAAAAAVSAGALLPADVDEVLSLGDLGWPG